MSGNWVLRDYDKTHHGSDRVEAYFSRCGSDRFRVVIWVLWVGVGFNRFFKKRSRTFFQMRETIYLNIIEYVNFYDIFILF